MKYLLLTLVSLVLSFTYLVNAHGRLWEPVARASAWRKGYKTPVNYDDVGFYCGGYSIQWRNNGSCGVCGDAITDKVPRSNELFGNLVKQPPVIVANYKKGEEIEISVDLTANHGGFFVFQVCPASSSEEVTEECLASGTMKVIKTKSSTKAPATSEIGVSNMDDLRPEDENVSTDDRFEEKTLLKYINQHITTVINPYNEPKYNYEFNATDVEAANVMLINGNTPKMGNRFNPVLKNPSLDQFKYTIPFEKARVYSVKVQLPQDLVCERCVLRWVYVAGNSWGICQKKGFEGAVGCGPQEEFRNCADISIS